MPRATSRTAQSPARRRTLWNAARWCGGVLCLTLLTLWIGSVWWYGWCATRYGVAIGVTHGQLALVKSGNATPAGWTFERTTKPRQIRLGFDGSMGGKPGSLPYASIPFWALLVPAIALTTLAWRAHRRSQGASGCAHCGYSREGLKHDAPCPECGRVPASAIDASSATPSGPTV